jgi:hypothetical protein
MVEAVGRVWSMTRAEYVEQHGCEPHDERYWGPGGVDLSRWGRGTCMMGLQYHQTGAAVASGTPGVVRKISSGRKTRGYASGSDGRVG